MTAGVILFPMIKLIRICAAGASAAAIIPKPMLRELGWARGDLLIVAYDKETVVLRKMNPELLRQQLEDGQRVARENAMGGE